MAELPICSEWCFRVSCCFLIDFEVKLAQSYLDLEETCRACNQMPFPQRSWVLLRLLLLSFKGDADLRKGGPPNNHLICRVLKSALVPISISSWHSPTVGIDLSIDQIVESRNLANWAREWKSWWALLCVSKCVCAWKFLTLTSRNIKASFSLNNHIMTRIYFYAYETLL
jgi:hypothetical protein